MPAEPHYYFSTIAALTKSNADSSSEKMASGRDHKLLIAKTIDDGQYHHSLPARQILRAKVLSLYSIQIK